jgi:uncharacterized protein with PhoU and TrkA domain
VLASEESARKVSAQLQHESERAAEEVSSLNARIHHLSEQLNQLSNSGEILKRLK